MRDDTRNWIALAEYDIETASHMLKSGRYLYVVFLCHLALEKMLKAHVTEVTQEFPAKTHDLIYLVRKCGLELPQDLLEFVGKINTASIPTRYPEDLHRALQEYPKPVVLEYLAQTRKVMIWLKERLEVS
ncbi:MAG: HEPN domain-containing protein [Anaerolineales bacterium]|nr:HEPN domain-containing protein [Anaerolineales bacterium]